VVIIFYSKVRRAASAALGEIGAESVPALLAALKEDAVWREGLAASALVKATPGATNLLAALLDAAQAEPAVRTPIAALLPRIGTPAAEALDRLLTGSDRRLKSWAVGVLRDFGTDAKVAVTNLLTILQAEDQWFRASAARTLGSIGPAAAPAVPALTERLKDEFAEARTAAATALGFIGVKNASVFEAIRLAAQDPNAEVAEAARAALTRLKE
jgi:HEAT repeat protein